MEKNHYTSKNASGLGLGAGFLQVRDGIKFPQGETSDNTALCPITFASKSLTSTEIRYIVT